MADMGVSFTNLKCHVATVPMRVYVTPSQRWKLPVENYECTIKENEGEGEGHGSDVNGTEDVNGTGDEVDVMSCIRHAAPTGGWITRGEVLICTTDE